MNAIEEPKKRNIAYKLRIGDLMKGKPNIVEGKLIFLEVGDKQVMRVNLIANVVDKYFSAGEKKYASLTLDDASGQIKLKAFGDDAMKLEGFMQGDSLQIIGNLREYNSELYLQPEVSKKVDPKWLLVRKLEMQKLKPVVDVSNMDLRGIIIDKIKGSEKEGGIDVEMLIMDVAAKPEMINSEIKKLLEEGQIYEPRPGRLRYLG